MQKAEAPCRASAFSMTVLPVEALSFTKLLTGHAAMPHQMGVTDEHGVVGFPIGHFGGRQRHIPQGFVVMLAVDAAAALRPIQVIVGISGTISKRSPLGRSGGLARCAAGGKAEQEHGAQEKCSRFFQCLQLRIVHPVPYPSFRLFEISRSVAGMKMPYLIASNS